MFMMYAASIVYAAYITLEYAYLWKLFCTVDSIKHTHLQRNIKSVDDLFHKNTQWQSVSQKHS